MVILLSQVHIVSLSCGHTIWIQGGCFKSTFDILTYLAQGSLHTLAYYIMKNKLDNKNWSI